MAVLSMFYGLIKLVQAWIIMHEEDLMANWELAINEKNIFRIEPLR